METGSTAPRPLLFSTAWDKAEPGNGYGAKAAEQAHKAHELDAELPPIELVEATPVKAHGK